MRLMCGCPSHGRDEAAALWDAVWMLVRQEPLYSITGDTTMYARPFDRWFCMQMLRYVFKSPEWLIKAGITRMALIGPHTPKNQVVLRWSRVVRQAVIAYL